MGDNRLVRIAVAATVLAGLGCAQPASAQSITDRFKSLFGGGSPSSGGGSPSMTDRFTQLFSGKSTEVGAPQSPQTCLLYTSDAADE